jgi:hypothetical protein
MTASSSWLIRMKLGDSQDCTVVDRDKDPTAGLPSTTLVPLATGVGRPAVGVAGDNDLLHEFPDSGPIRIDDIRISTFGILTAVAGRALRAFDRFQLCNELDRMRTVNRAIGRAP